MKVVVLGNTQLGSWRGRKRGALDRVAAALARTGHEIDFQRLPPEAIRAAARAAVEQGADVVVAVGGDGTISSVAGALVDTPAALGVVPLGTFNHFARDLGIPLALEQAVKVVAAGHGRRIDVGQVGTHTFINNASIGAYPAMVIDRQQQQIRFGRPKWRAMLRAGWRVLRRFPRMDVRLTLAAEAPWCSTPCLFVGNNSYRFDLLARGSRPALDRGKLSVYVLRVGSRMAVVRLGLRAALGKLAHDGSLVSAELEEFWVDCRRHHVPVGCDGEVLRLQPPLHFCIRPRALAVIVPAPHGATD